MRSQDIISICTILLASIYLYAAFHIPSIKGAGDPLGPKVFPVLISIGLMLSALLLHIEKILAKKKLGSPKQEISETKTPLLLIGVIVCWTFIFYIFFEKIGYLLSTTLYLFVLMTFLNRKKLWTNAIISISFSLGTHSLFVKCLNIILPKGLLYF